MTIPKAVEGLGHVLGLSRPVLLAPMAAISGGRLAAAFSAGGGYGFLGGGYGVGTWIEDQWADASGADIGVGLITWRLTDDVLDRVLALGPRAVWLGFGDPSPFAARIIDADDLRSALSRGAAGVALGTAAYATAEALDADLHKTRIVEATGDATVVSTLYDHLRGPVWPEGFAGRALRSDLTDRWVDHEDDLASRADLQDWYRNVMPTTAPEQRVLWAGEAASRVTRIVPARELVESFPTVEELARRGRAAP